MRRPEKKTVIIASCILAAAVLFTGVYFWYTGTYGAARKFKIDKMTSLDYEWKEKASDCGLTKDYIFSRTKKLMLEGGSDGTLIPSEYMIAGRLRTQPAEELRVYDLSDQAMLLKLYVVNSDRFKANDLVSAVNSRIDLKTASTLSKVDWLDAYLYYYSSYGTGSDLEYIKELVGSIFSEDGTVKPHTVKIAYYEGTEFQSVAGDVPVIDGASLEDLQGYENDKYREIEGVLLSEIDLKLIRTLETNGLLPEGSFSKDLALVTGGIVSSDIPLFAYAYSLEDDGTPSYCYQKDHAATVSVTESVKTMRNLAEVDALPDSSFSWIKNAAYSSSVIYDTYYIISGQTDGGESYDSYTDIMAIAISRDDLDLFAKMAEVLGSRVATYSKSPALSMIYRMRDERFVFVAKENLDICLLLG